MKRFLYRFGDLLLVLCCIPMAVLPILLRLQWLPDISLWSWISLLWGWMTFFILLASRRAAAQILSEACVKLDQACDPEGFLQDMHVLLSKLFLTTRSQVLYTMQQVVGLDAAGRNEEALQVMEALQHKPCRLTPYEQIMMAIYEATLCLHATPERAMAEFQPRLEAVRRLIETQPLPPQAVSALRGQVDMLQDGYEALYGSLSDADGLRERLTGRIRRYRTEPRARRVLVSQCMQLGRLYERLGMRGPACGMYRYVAEMGNGLGIVQQAKERQAALLRTAPAEPEGRQNSASCS